MLNKIETKVFSGCFLLFSIYIFILNVIEIQKNNYWVIIFSLVAIGLIFLAFKKRFLAFKNKKLLRILTILIFVLNFAFSLYLGYKLMVKFNWDYGVVQRNAINYAFNKEIDFNNLTYFIRYPNNRLILIFLSSIYRMFHTIFGVSSTSFFVHVSIFINCIFIELAYFFTYLLAKKYRNEHFAFVVLLLLFLMIPLLAYSAIFYSDTLSLPFYPLLIYLYLKYKESNIDKSKIWYLILISTISLIGFMIKATVIFALFAIIIDIICNNKFVSILKSLIIIILVFAGVYLALDKGMNAILNITESVKDKYQFPYTHHVMMMLNKTGGYIEEDVTYTKSFNTISEKKKANIEKIKERLEERGFFGTIYHLGVKKMIRTWTDSSFAARDYLGRSPEESNIWNSIITTNGENYKYFYIYTSIYWLIMILGLILTFVSRKEKNDIITLSMIIIILLALFLTIWECNSRYVLQIVPVIVLTAIAGWSNFMKKFNLRKEA